MCQGIRLDLLPRARVNERDLVDNVSRLRGETGRHRKPFRASSRRRPPTQQVLPMATMCLLPTSLLNFPTTASCRVPKSLSEFPASASCREGPSNRAASTAGPTHSCRLPRPGQGLQRAIREAQSPSRQTFVTQSAPAGIGRTCMISTPSPARRVKCG